MVSFQTASAATHEIIPVSVDEMRNRIYSFISDNLNARTTSFQLEITGDLLQTLDVDNEPYFGAETPFNRYKYTAGNDYNATVFSSDRTSVFQVGSKIFRKTQGMKTTIVSVTLSYTAYYEETLSQTQAVKDYAKQTNNRILTSAMKPYQKTRAIHDYMINEYQYGNNQTHNSPYAVAVKKEKYSCESITALFYIMLKDAGIESRIILKDTGNQPSKGASAKDGKWMNHTWNEVKLDGKWYHVDLTWNDSTGQPLSYFLKSSSVFSADHKWDKSSYPAANESYGQSAAPTQKTTAKTAVKTTRNVADATTVTAKEANADIDASVVETQSVPKGTVEVSSVQTQPTVKIRANQNNSQTGLIIGIGSLLTILFAGGGFFLFHKKRTKA